MEVVTKQVDTAQPIQQEVVTKQVDTAQPIQKEVVTEQVDTTQPIHQERQVLLSMGGGHSDDQLPLPTTQPDVCERGSYTTSPQESDNHRQAQTN